MERRKTLKLFFLAILTNWVSSIYLPQLQMLGILGACFRTFTLFTLFVGNLAFIQVSVTICTLNILKSLCVVHISLVSSRFLPLAHIKGFQSDASLAWQTYKIWKGTYISVPYLFPHSCHQSDLQYLETTKVEKYCWQMMDRSRDAAKHPTNIHL